MTSQTIALIQVISTVVVTVANVFLIFLTYRYVRLTAGMLDHMRNMQTSCVVVDIVLSGESAYLEIANTGSLAATNVAVEELSGFQWSYGDTLQDLTKHGVSYLPAGRTLKFWLGFPDWDRVKKDSSVVNVGVAYENNGRREHRQFTIDMRQFLGSAGDSSSVDRIVNAIDQLRQAQENKDFHTQNFFRPPQKYCIECAELIPKAAKTCSRCATKQMPVSEPSVPPASVDVATARNRNDTPEAHRAGAPAEQSFAETITAQSPAASLQKAASPKSLPFVEREDPSSAPELHSSGTAPHDR